MFSRSLDVFLVFILAFDAPYILAWDDYSEWASLEKVCIRLPGIKLDNSSAMGETPWARASPMTTCSSLVNETRAIRSGAAVAANMLRMTNSKFNADQRKAIVDLHNEFRAMVQPPAADMNFMEWHEDAASLAQTYAEHCIFEHGFPTGHQLSDKLGQNLYMGPNKDGLRAVKLWFEERKDFNIHTLHCAAEMCGHYTQVAWAGSRFVGCGIKKCSMNQNLIVCHYFPTGNYVGEAPYKIGYPCSNCPDIKDGATCSKNACVSQDQCKKLQLPNCGCNLHCHNCGRLDASKCRCKCLPGWDQLDCSVPCMDAHEKCGKSPGFPSQQSCWRSDIIKSSYCRKMCHQCTPITQKNDPSKLCCAGIICQVGQVLDQNCQCVQKCLGNNCLGGTNKGQRLLLDGILLGFSLLLEMLILAVINIVHYF